MGCLVNVSEATKIRNIIGLSSDTMNIRNFVMWKRK